MAPGWVGVECLNGNVCTDDTARLIEATRLYAAARDFVQAKVGMIRNEPRIVFCTTPECSRSFGFTNQLAYTVGTMRVVISHRDWRPYLVRYELIRHLQNERLGSLNMVLFKPTWFREGMAASLSDDQHRPLPEPLNFYRSKFEEWYGKIDKKALWVEAARL
jgi:hypothetical protein